MSIVLNETEIGSEITLNNTDLSEIIFNGVSVWTAEPPYYNELKNGQTLTEAQWLAFLNGNGIKYIINKGETSAFLGKKVSLTNSSDSTYTTWSIGDFNHDSTSNTCDLILDNTIHSTKFGYSQTYSGSTPRVWLIETYYNGFSTDIKNKLQTMAVASNGSTLNDKIKLLSHDEVGLTSANLIYQYSVREGSRYPIFPRGGSGNYNTNSDRIRTGANSDWWLRSRYTNNTGYVWLVNSGGTIYYISYSDKCGLLPAIRFA